MIDPRLQTLRVLYAEQTVTAAAAALHLTPSTVSQQLRQLAAELGVQLLEPQGRRVRLTAAAHTLLAHADELQAQWERASADLNTHRAGEAGQLRLSGVATAVANLIAPAMRTLRERHPQLTVEIGEDAGADRFRLLLTGRTDIAVVIPAPDSPPPDDSRFEQHLLLEEPQDLLVPADHHFATRERVELGEATDEIWIRAGDPQDQHQLLLTACAAAGYTPHLAHNAIDWFAIGAMVAHGYGICLMPRLAPLPPGLEVTRVPLTGKSAPTRQLIACVRRGSSDQVWIKRGIDALRDTAAESRALAST